MLSLRSLISLSQFLNLQPRAAVEHILEKRGIPAPRTMSFMRTSESQTEIRDWLRTCNHEQIAALLEEIFRSTRLLYASVQPKYMYNERWDDLVRCFLLDGYRVTGTHGDGYELVPVDPTIETAAPLEDDFSIELERSGLPDRAEINRLMKTSAEDFCRQPQNFNGALTTARVAMETLVKNIAATHSATIPFPGDPTKFGASLAYLRHQVNLLTENEEKGIAGVYAFVSPGAHIPIGFTEEEMVRLGRSMIGAMCYFLAKRHNG